MRIPEYVRLGQRIDNLLKTIPSADEELRSELLKLTAVLSAGYVEIACQEIFARYSEVRSCQEVGAFVAGQLARFQNMTPTKVCDLVTMFGKTHGEAVKSHIEDQIAASLQSLVNLRNVIAHGRDMSVGHAVLRQYFQDVGGLVRFLEARFPSAR